MSFLREHFDHFVLAGLAVASAVAGVWCEIHNLTASKWMFGQATGFASALMLRMNAQKHTEPTVAPSTDPPLPSRAKSD